MKKKLEELNLTDNFLFGSMVEREGTGEDLVSLYKRKAWKNEEKSARASPLYGRYDGRECSEPDTQKDT